MPLLSARFRMIPHPCGIHRNHYLVALSFVFCVLFFILAFGQERLPVTPLTNTVYNHISSTSSSLPWPSWLKSKDPLLALASNATLGFETVLALSARRTPWRITGLLAAANTTSINVLIPALPIPSAPEVEEFRATFHDPTPGFGSAAAWLSHLALLRHIVASNYTTALVVEDDADWDVAVRAQMALVSTNIRQLLPDAEPATTPYGKSWDVLWLGNCGDNTGPDVPAPNSGTFQTRRLRMWRDETAVAHANYSGWAHNSVAQLPEGTRAVMLSRGPICTYGYAVTHAGAQRVVSHAGERAGERAGENEAFDVKLSALCRDGVIECVSVLPEIIHEYRPPASEDGGRIASEVDAQNGQGEMTRPGEVMELGMGTTLNIVNSARCAALFGQTCFPGRTD